MRNARAEARRTPAGILVLAAALLTVGSLFGADQPLSQDDVTLLLLGGASPEKIISLVEQRGVTFQMNPDLAKKFHDQGASDEVIEALQKALRLLARSGLNTRQAVERIQSEIGSSAEIQSLLDFIARSERGFVK